MSSPFKIRLMIWSEKIFTEKNDFWKLFQSAATSEATTMATTGGVGVVVVVKGFQLASVDKGEGIRKGGSLLVSI